MNSALEISPNAVHRMLTNPYFKGSVVSQGTSYKGAHAALLLADFEAGAPIRGLARKHKLHRSTAIRSLRRAGVSPQRPTPITKQPELVARAIQLREEGLTLRKIGKVMGLSHPSVHRLLNA
ncbi:MAG: hypothetical protein LBH48_02045 [Bifidobacteriaceae bacterium]|jgi:transposase-like protein|nr:hypothetical protein [Bifidobacteriaceae bacterium]